MKITIVTGPFYPVPPAPCGAVERMWQNLAEVFAARGHSVTVLCRHWPGQAKDETIRGVQYVRRMQLSHTRSIKWDLLQDLWYSLRMWCLLPRADVTVTNVFWLPVLMRWRKRAGAVVVNVNRWPKGQMKLYSKAHRLAAASCAVAEEIIRQCPSVAPRVKVIPNPIDTVVFRPPSEPRAARPGAGTILYTGRVHPEKGVHLLVSAFAKLHEEFDRLRLRVVGPRSVDTGGGGDDYVEQLKRLAGDRPVEFIDPIYDRSALARELQSADYYCYPSLAAKGEALPVAPMEAMATGLPVVVSNLPVFRDILTPSHSGMVFDHTTSDAAQTLAQSLRQLIEDPLVAQRLGQQASQAAQRFSIENVASLCLEDFEQLIQR